MLSPEQSMISYASKQSPLKLSIEQQYEQVLQCLHEEMTNALAENKELKSTLQVQAQTIQQMTIEQRGLA